MAVELGTKQKAIREGLGLLQRLGFNGFSFQHIADSLGIRKPSLYAHFESKEALGLDMLDSFKQSFTQWTDAMSEMEPRLKVSAYFDMIYKFSQKGGLYCPVASLNAEAHTLPGAMKKRLKAIHDMQAGWMKRVVAEGQGQGHFRNDLEANELAEFIISLGIGSQFLGRIHNEADKIKMIKRHALIFLNV